MSRPLSPLQHLWDSAAHLAGQGLKLPEITGMVVDSAGPQIEQDTRQSVPDHGRTFWAAVARSVGWGVATELALLAIGSIGAGPGPVLRLIIYSAVLVFSIAFGVMWANHTVRERRLVLGAARRDSVVKLAQEAAQHVWATQVAGSWRPLGPAVQGSTTTDPTLPAAWLRRFAVAEGQAIAWTADGTLSSLRRSIDSARTVPVVLFVPEPGVFTDEARSLADDSGVALFVLGRRSLVAMSHAASAALKAYSDPASTQGPVAELMAAWAGARSARSP